MTGIRIISCCSCDAGPVLDLRNLDGVDSVLSFCVDISLSITVQNSPKQQFLETIIEYERKFSI